MMNEKQAIKKLIEMNVTVKEIGLVSKALEEITDKEVPEKFEEFKASIKREYGECGIKVLNKMIKKDFEAFK